MLSAIDRINNVLSNEKELTKNEIFQKAELSNSDSNNFLFQILLKNKKIIGTGKGRGRKYSLPLFLYKPKDGKYSFIQNGDEKIYFKYEQELEENDFKIFDSYNDFYIFIKQTLIK